jgi:hypothetical protein
LVSNPDLHTADRGFRVDRVSRKYCCAVAFSLAFLTAELPAIWLNVIKPQRDAEHGCDSELGDNTKILDEF